ncbi:MAG: M56 family metallopeptidase [Bacteroidota bacterium]
MKLLAIAVLSDHLVNALGSTLLHSLWQGLILVGLTGLIIIITRSCKPSTRYNLLVFTLFSFFAISAITFVTTFANLIAMPVAQEGYLGSDVNQKGLPENALLTQAKTYLADHNNTLVLIWFLIVGARCIQLFVGLNNLNHLRKNATFTVSVQWDEKVKNFAKQLGINRAIRMAECGLVRVPMVIGHLKPLILIPMGLLTALQPKEIEAILVHELAHIYRRDYLINLLQSVMEILFFFNPAVLWLSTLIKAERENCCDDMAVKYTSNKVNYISALIACQEYQLAVPAYAMTFSRRGGLRNRVHRLVANSNTSLTRFEKSILAFCMVTASLLLIGFGNEAKIKKMMKETTLSPKITQVEVKQNTLKHQNCLPVTSVNTLTPLRLPDTVYLEETIYLDSLKALSNLQKINAEKMQRDGLILLNEDISPVNKAKAMARIDSIRQSLRFLRDTIKMTSLDHKLSPLKVKLSMPIKSSQRVPVKLDLSDLIEKALRNDGILIETDSSFSFMLSKHDLIVNGKKQSSVIHKKYKEKYVPQIGNNGWYLYKDYNRSRKTVITKELDLAFNFNQLNPLYWHYGA